MLVSLWTEEHEKEGDEKLEYKPHDPAPSELAKTKNHQLRDLLQGTVRDSQPKTQADPKSLNHSSMKDSMEYLSGSLTIRYEKKLRRITLQRILLSRLVWHADMITFPEILVLYDNQVHLETYASKNPQFLKKFGDFLTEVNKVLKKTRISTKNAATKVHEMARELKGTIEGYLIPQRNLLHTGKYIEGKFHVLPSESHGKATRELPKKAYIGVGYKDKGARRDPAYDASPHWKEVARWYSMLENDK